MSIEVFVYCKNDRRRAIAHDLLEWSIRRLMPMKRILTVELTVEQLCKNEHGSAGWVDNWIQPKEFQIQIATGLNLPTYIETIIHEMIHVKQYSRGELKDRFPLGATSKKLWKGRDHTKTSYSRMPWERQAYNLSGKLVAEYNSYRKNAEVRLD